VQINCTYYSALGSQIPDQDGEIKNPQQDEWYILARAIQFFTPGIPLVYYVGLLAGENDFELVDKTLVGRDINRHFYSPEEATAECDRPVVKV
jgi:sucrose phosphorylase